MDRTVQASGVARQHRLPDVAERMAKAAVRKADLDPSAEWRARVGQAIDRARNLRGWNLDELAYAVGRDARQVKRWIAGEDRPQFDALFAVESFRRPLVIALAELAGDGVEVETVVRVRRIA